MIIATSLTTNEIKFIPRDGTPFNVEIRDEQTKELTNLTPTFSNEGYYKKFTLVMDLIESRQYRIVISSTSKVLYRDLILATTQDITDYTLNKDEYSEPVEQTSTKYKII